MLADNIPSLGAALPTGVALGSLSAGQVADLSRAAGEPAWLTSRRSAAWEHYATADMPRWSRTDLGKLRLDHLVPAVGPSATAVQWDEGLARQGVVFTTLKAALRDHGALIDGRLGTAIDPLTNKFSALHAALWQDGALLYVPKNVVVEQPLRVVYTLADSGRLIAPHTLIVLDRGASATLIEEFVSPDGLEQPLALPTVEAFVGDGAQLRLCSVQQWGSGVYHIGGQRVILDRDAGCDWVSVALGGQLQHIDAETRMQGNGSRVSWMGATFANQQQLLVTGPWLRHIGNNTDAHMEFKTVVGDQGYAVFDGMVRIEHDTHGTISRLEEHAIHLSPEARNDSIPGLMIDSNDIARAGHASTSGRIDDEQLFYMQARGITRADATRMIIIGFLTPVIEAIPVEDLRERLIAAVEEKI